MTKSSRTAIIVVGVLIVVAAIIQFGLTNSAVSSAESARGFNNLLTDSAPQQQVANGWYHADQLDIIIQQNQALLIVLAGIVLIITIGLATRSVVE